ATAIRIAHFEGGPNRYLHGGMVTYKDVNGLLAGHTYSYRFTAVKKSNSGAPSVESVTANGTTLPTVGCLATTTTTVIASPASISVGASGSITLTAQVSKLSGATTAVPTGTVSFFVYDSTNQTLYEIDNVALNGSAIAT